jgi:hypothetical protein
VVHTLPEPSEGIGELGDEPLVYGVVLVVELVRAERLAQDHEELPDLRQREGRRVLPWQGGPGVERLWILLSPGHRLKGSGFPPAKPRERHTCPRERGIQTSTDP